jgi:glycine/D-amino acid oxidase-like deaminating enzyme
VAGQVGLVTADGHSHRCDRIVVAAGSWTGKLLPELAEDLRAFAQPVFHLRPEDPAPYEAIRFPVFTADIARLGYYGFPVNGDGIVKVAHHGPGRRMDPDDPVRVPDEEQVEELRGFLRHSLPGLADAPIAEARLCLYCDTWDGHFWIDQHPARPGVVVAAGGSGHAFKFAPLIGDIIADVVEDRPRPDALRERFRYRPERRHVRSEEAARKLSTPPAER